MYESYNPHPQNKIVEDCVKRAFTKASGKTYQEVSNELNRIKRELDAKKYNSNVVWRYYVDKVLNGKKISFPAVKGEPRMNGYKFCEQFSKGTYVLHMAGHLSCCVDGVIYDTWDCQDKCVYTAWEIPKLIPMPGSEKLEGYYDGDAEKEPAEAPTVEETLRGLDIIKSMSGVAQEIVQFTKKNEPWIDLNADQYAKVLSALTTNPEYQNLRWKTRRGSSKSTIIDENTGMTLILKNGTKPYLWCIQGW